MTAPAIVVVINNVERTMTKHIGFIFMAILNCGCCKNMVYNIINLPLINARRESRYNGFIDAQNI